MTTTKHITRTTRDLGQQVQIVLVTNTSSIRAILQSDVVAFESAMQHCGDSGKQDMLVRLPGR